MKKPTPFSLVALLAMTAIIAALAFAQFAVAAEAKEGRMTEIIRDVRLLASGAAARSASLNDNVREGTAVRTGDESRAEITFNDQSLTRLGANTVFSFGKGTKTYDLGSGAILMYAPEKAGQVKIHTSVATAAVTGFTALLESHPKSWSKLIILHGKAKVTFNDFANEPCHLHDAQMIIWPPRPRACPTVYDVDISKVLKGKLIKGFKRPLPEYNIFLQTIKNIESDPPPGGLTDPTGHDAIDKRSSTERQDHTPPPQHSPPPK